MPMLAVCPYCGEGKVRSPEPAIGMTVTCPRCQVGFTVSVTDLVTDTERLTAPVREAAATATTTTTTTLTGTPAITAAATTSTAVAAVTVQVAAVTEPRPAPAAAGPKSAELDEATPGSETDLGMAGGLLAIILAGIGMFVSQVPYGRIITVFLSLIGLLVGLFGWLVADGRRTVPVSGAALNGVLLLVTLFLPDWLGLSGWKPLPSPGDDPHLVRAVGLDNNTVTPADWVNASAAAWQREDVRITAGPVAHGPVELTNAKKQKARTKEPYLQILVTVRNIGAARKIEFRGWTVPAPVAAGDEPPADAASPKPVGPVPLLFDPATNKTFPLKAFQAGWDPPGKAVPAGLFPARLAEQILIFEAPADLPERLHLELPGEAFGDAEPVRFVIPRTMVSYRIPPR